MVLKMSAETGEIFDSYGPGKLDKEQATQALAGIWAPVWHVDLVKQVKDAIERLHGSGLPVAQ